VYDADNALHFGITDLQGQIDDLVLGEWAVESNGKTVTIEIENFDGRATELTFEAEVSTEVRRQEPGLDTSFIGLISRHLSRIENSVA